MSAIRSPMVIAETKHQARDAAERVMVDYEELPAVIDPAKAHGRRRAADPSGGPKNLDLRLVDRR